MHLIFLYGLPATGKFTIGEQIARRTGYKLFHYHLAADPLLAIFQFGSAAFVDLRETLWLAIIERAARAHFHGLIFTFLPERSVRPQFIPNLIQLAAHNHVDIHTIHLICLLDEIKRRLDAPDRHSFQKLTSIPLFNALHSNGAFSPAFPIPKPDLTFDTSQITSQDAARQIIALCKPLHPLEHSEL